MLDLGSGGGVPGLVLADGLARAPSSSCSTRSSGGRASCHDAVDALGLADACASEHGRAEDARPDRPDGGAGSTSSTARSLRPASGDGRVRARRSSCRAACCSSPSHPARPTDRWPADGLDELALTDDGPGSTGTEDDRAPPGRRWAIAPSGSRGEPASRRSARCSPRSRDVPRGTSRTAAPSRRPDVPRGTSANPCARPRRSGSIRTRHDGRAP